MIIALLLQFKSRKLLSMYIVLKRLGIVGVGDLSTTVSHPALTRFDSPELPAKLVRING